MTRDDPVSIAAPFSYDASKTIRGRRLGYFPADFDASEAADLDKSVLETAKQLGLELVPLTHTDLPYDTLMSTLFAEAAASFEDLTLENRDDELTWQAPGAWPNTFRKARFLSAIDHIQLDRLRRLVMQVMDEKFLGLDAIIGPALAGPMLVITNFTGHPSLILRTGFRQSETRSPLSLAKGRIEQGSPTAGPSPYRSAWSLPVRQAFRRRLDLRDRARAGGRPRCLRQASAACVNPGRRQWLARCLQCVRSRHQERVLKGSDSETCVTFHYRA